MAYENTFLTLSGLSYFLGKLKTIFQLQEEGKGLSQENFTTTLKDKLDGIEAEAQVNIIESITVNDEALTVTDKGVSFHVPTTVSELTDSSDYQTVSDFNTSISAYSTTTQMNAAIEDAVSGAIASAYKISPSVSALNQLPALTEANIGKVSNLTVQATSTADFVEGAGKELPAGTNIVVVEVSAATFVATEDATAQAGKIYYADAEGTALDTQPTEGADISSAGYYEEVPAVIKYDSLAGFLEFNEISNSQIDALFQEEEPEP